MFNLPEQLDSVGDERSQPRIKTGLVLRSLVVMFLSRLGSLNALEQVRKGSFWKKWAGGEPPSADSTGRICTGIDVDALRRVNHGVYTRLKRNKVIRAVASGLIALVFDGHESHCSHKQRCEGCLSRRVKTKNGNRTEFYHRNVTAMLVARDFVLLIDAEPQRPGEDERTTALRLFDRVFKAYPRAFDVVVADAMYTDPRFYRHVLESGKHLLTVLKENQPSLLGEARTLLDLVPSEIVDSRSERVEMWDADGFSMAGLEKKLRVVRSLETRTIHRQLNDEDETTQSEWYWVTTLSEKEASRRAIAHIGHRRWAIENEGFNECVRRWHADHVYRHHPTAILAFWLVCMTAFNLFQAFFSRNLKQQYRFRISRQHVSELIRTELYRALPAPCLQPP